MNIPALQDYFAAVALRPQRLGMQDCCTFVVEALLVGWDRDYRDALHYHDRRSAVTQLRKEGGLREACVHVLGPEHLLDDAPPGSVAWMGDLEQTCIGLVMPGYIAVKANRTIHRIAPNENRTGWRTD